MAAALLSGLLFQSVLVLYLETLLLLYDLN